ncbi:MAG: ATP-binding protein [archaeon]|nr:ATP-binding protein [archaeon]
MEILKREMYLSRIRPFYRSDLIKILVGMRRCGKSTILKQIMQELRDSHVDEEHILYLNFEMIKYRDLQDAVSLERYISDRIGDNGAYFLFFDEIQKVDDFEDAINSLRVSYDCSIFITGSNEKLLSSELKTELTGRYVEFRIQPFTYREVTLLKELNGQQVDEKTFEDYLKWGGLPQRFFFERDMDISTYLSDVYDSIVSKDIMQRFNIKNPEILIRIVDYLIDNSSRLFSVNNVVEYLKVNKMPKSTETVYNYVAYAISSLVVDKVRRFDTKGKKILASTEKYYCTDPGLRNTRSVDSGSDIGVNLELVVYNELVARGYKVVVGITPRSEIDFIVERNGKKAYVQVTYMMGEEKTREREFGSLLTIQDNHPKYVLSMDRFDMSCQGVVHLNLVDWLLGNTKGSQDFESI